MIAKLYQKANTVCEVELTNWILFLPLWIGIGIIFCFRGDFEMGLFPLITSILLLALNLYFYQRSSPFKSQSTDYQNPWSFIIFANIAIVSALCGCLFATHRLREKHYILEQNQEGVISGKIEEIEIYEKKSRIYLSHLKDSEGSENLAKLEQIRLIIKEPVNNLSIGDVIKVRVSLMPLPSQVYPNGFDFARFAYFKKIGAIGFATGRLQKITSAKKSIQNEINHLRQKIAINIKSHIPQREAAVAIALLVGKTSEILESDNEAIRAAGVAHLLAISGLHVSVVAVIIFMALEFLGSCFPRIAISFQIKKLAAAATIVVSLLYLLLAGTPLSAQRAFITSSIMFIALILNRPSTALHSLAIAGIFSLITTPESLFSPSLQMSFAACLGLIKVFQLRPSRNGAISLFIASLAACVSTLPFTVYHFNQFSVYGVITNLFCVPLSDFCIMPLGILSMILMPLGLERLSLIPMGWGIKVLLYISHLVIKLPYAVIHIPSLGNIGICLVGFGIVVFCICSTKELRIMSLIAIGVGYATMCNHKNPDLIISQKLFAVKLPSMSQYIFSSKQCERYSQEIWKKTLGVTNFSNRSLNHHKIPDCNSASCIFETNLGRVVIYHPKDEASPAVFKKLCSSKNLALFVNLNDITECTEALNNITLATLQEKGNHLVYFQPGKITIESVAASKVHGKPWS